MRIGPFVTHLTTELQSVAEAVHFFCGNYAIAPDETVSDFHVRLAAPPGIRRWYRKQVLFLMDGQNQFQSFPFDLAPPLFEWGLNWCISNRAHQYLIVHSAVVERNGRALVLPARPGSGKSTLCAGLVHRGFRLLSDEHVLLRPEDGRVVAVPRPIALKNESIPVIRQLAPELVLGPSFHDVEKGEVSHVRPPAASVARAEDTALPSAVIFPKFTAGCATRLVPVRKAAALMELIDNSVNYGVLGHAGFETLANLVDASACAALDYADIEEALDLLEHLARTTPRRFCSPPWRGHETWPGSGPLSGTSSSVAREAPDCLPESERASRVSAGSASSPSASSPRFERNTP